MGLGGYYMIIGVGVDIVEIDRISNVVNKNPRFLERNFTAAEIAIFQSKSNPFETIAAHFAAKEAVAKAFGTGIKGFNLIDLSIERNFQGAPIVKCSNGAELLKQSLNVQTIHLSISHSQHYAIAYAVAEK
jgi:holo-[acyl-carrier protein] synthase